MPTQDEITAQEKLLDQHRRNLAQLLLEEAQHGGEGLAPNALVNGITAARDPIRRTKEILHAWEVIVQDHRVDDPEPWPRMVKEEDQELYYVDSDGALLGAVIGVNAGAISYTEIQADTPDTPLPSTTHQPPPIQIGDQERQNLRDLLRAHESRLQVLELQQAKFGAYAPPQVVTEIAEIQLKIAAINVRLVVATPPLDRSRVRELQAQALKAIARKKWGEAENLLSQALATDLEDRDTWERLQIVQRHLNTDALYQAIRELREEDDWQAVLVALDELARQQSDFSDPDGLRVWAEGRRQWQEGYAKAREVRAKDDWQAVLGVMSQLAHQLGDVPDPDDLWAWGAARQRQSERYKEAIFARKRGDWRAVIDELDGLAAEFPDYGDSQGLRAWAEQQQQRAHRYAAVIVALEAVLAEYPDDSEARKLLVQARTIISGRPQKQSSTKRFQRDIEEWQELLSEARQELFSILKRYGGPESVPYNVLEEIEQDRRDIYLIKDELRRLGVVVSDEPGDT